MLADSEFQVWSGYFTSRAALKGAVRKLDNLLETADAFFSVARRESEAFFNMSGAIFAQLEAARRYSGILCHHDAITGTARDFVVADYFSMLSNATAAAQFVLESAVSSLLGGAPVTGGPSGTNTSNVVVASTSVHSSFRIGADLAASLVPAPSGAPCQPLLDGGVHVKVTGVSCSPQHVTDRCVWQGQHHGICRDQGHGGSLCADAGHCTDWGVSGVQQRVRASVRP
jgi:hypothetical protein